LMHMLHAHIHQQSNESNDISLRRKEMGRARRMAGPNIANHREKLRARPGETEGARRPNRCNKPAHMMSCMYRRPRLLSTSSTPLRKGGAQPGLGIASRGGFHGSHSRALRSAPFGAARRAARLRIFSIGGARSYRVWRACSPRFRRRSLRPVSACPRADPSDARFCELALWLDLMPGRSKAPFGCSQTGAATPHPARRRRARP